MTLNQRKSLAITNGVLCRGFLGMLALLNLNSDVDKLLVLAE